MVGSTVVQRVRGSRREGIGWGRWAAVVAAVALACDDATGPDTGGIAILVVPQAAATAGAPGATADPTPVLDVAVVDQVTVEVDGPTPRTTNLTRNNATNRWEGEITGLDPGRYSVVLFGNSQGEVEFFGSAPSVNVSAGVTSNANINNWGDFRPATINVPGQTTAFNLDVTWNAVSTATGYIVQWADNQQFASLSADTVTGTSATVTLPEQTNTYFVRLRSTNAAVPTGGKPSDPVSIAVVSDISSSGDTPANAPDLGFVPSNQTIPDLNIFPANDQDWFTFDACAADLVTIEVRADRLTPPSNLDSFVALFFADDGSTVDSNDDLNPGSSVDAGLTDVVLPNSGTFWIGVTALGSASVGHYELDLNVTPGPNNQGNGQCGSTDLHPTSIDTPTQSSARPRGILRVDVGVTNLGDGNSATGWTGEIRLSTSSPVTSSDLLLASYVEDVSIGSGATANRSLAIPLPVGLASGTYFIGLIADPGDAVAEDDESNNVVTSSSTFDVGNVPAFFPDIDSHWDHTCRLDGAGAAQCWGLNLDGQLGDGTQNISSAPVSVQGGHIFRQITTGLFHTCGIDDSNAALCWGWNGDGQVGDPATVGTDVLTPTPVTGGVKFVRIDTGHSHNCGIATDGTMWCWGVGNDGELGDGNSTNSDQPVQVSTASVGFWIDVAAGDRFSCGVADNHTVWCWGRNSLGQLGNGTNTNADVPQQISGIVAEKVVAGNDFACHVNFVGGLFCWGANAQSQLGDGTQTTALDPVQVPGAWNAVVAGGFHTCGLRDDATMWCWGLNNQGQLGDGSIAQPNGGELNPPVQVAGPIFPAAMAAGRIHSCAVDPSFGADRCWGSSRLGQLGDGAPVVGNVPSLASTLPSPTAQVTTGWYHTCAATTLNTDLCWGNGNFGQIGSAGVGFNSINPNATNVDNQNLAVTQIVSANAHTCASDGGLTAFCWGLNDNMQLGDNTFNNSTVGVLAPNPVGQTYIGLTTGYWHTCALFVTSQAFCWGDNARGQLGNGNTIDQGLPVSIGSLILEIGAGQEHTCIVNASGNVDGDLECWGRNDVGQLGDGTTNDRAVRFTLVPSNGRRYVSVTGGDFHTCAVQSATAGGDGRPAGTGWCWGENVFGELGDGTTTNTTTPVEVADGHLWAILDAGDDHTCGVTTGGEAYCWGLNNSGQLGDGTFFSSNTPQLVAGGHVWASISAGIRHTCGVTTSEQTFCWGSNLRGERGNGLLEIQLTPTSVLPAPRPFATGPTTVRRAGQLSGRTAVFWSRVESEQELEGLAPPLAGGRRQ